MSAQAVTVRYINRLLLEGKNDDYEVESLSQSPATVDNIPIGIYFKVALKKPKEDFKQCLGIGATPVKAVQRALESDGVTFR